MQGSYSEQLGVNEWMVFFILQNMEETVAQSQIDEPVRVVPDGFQPGPPAAVYKRKGGKQFNTKL
jgi:hypothetical protein